MTTASLEITGMTCAGCQSTVERALTAAPGVTAARVNLLQHQAVIDYDASQTSPAALIASVQATGYGAALPVPGSIEVRKPDIDSFGHEVLGGMGQLVASEIQERTGIESRTTVLGYVQRGGSPVAFDRVLGTRFGVAAVDAAAERAFGSMVALQADRIVRIPVAEAIGHLKTVDSELLRTGAMFHPPRP